MGESVSESVVEYVELALISIPIDEEVLQEEDDGCNSEEESSTSHCEEEEECNCILCRGTQLIRNKTRYVFKRHSTRTSLGHPIIEEETVTLLPEPFSTKSKVHTVLLVAHHQRDNLHTPPCSPLSLQIWTVQWWVWTNKSGLDLRWH